MKRYKKTIYILFLTLLIYFISSYIYSKYVTENEYVKVYYLATDVKRGQKLDDSLIKPLYINKQKNLDISSIDILNKYITEAEINNAKDSVFKYDCYTGQILSKDIILEQKTYLKSNNNYEIIAINLDDISDSLASKVQKGSIVNIYYTGKLKQSENIISNTQESVISNSLSDGYISTQLLENVKVIATLDKEGNEVNVNENKLATSKNIASVLIQTDKINVLKINNLKKYGSFSLSIVS